MSTRRDLLVHGAALLALGCTPTPKLTDTHDTDRNTDDTEGGHTGETGDTGELPDECLPTALMDAGPYYRADAPARTDLRTLGEEGVILRLAGRVRSSLDCRPLEGATVEIWHAQMDGLYDMQTNDMHYRTTLTTADKGRFDITTFHPPSYGADDAEGDLIQSHFHVWIRHPEHEELVTQLRFAGDPNDDGMTPLELLLEVETNEDGSEDMSFVFAMVPV